MAVAYVEGESTEENFSRLNRLLAELYEVLCHILVARQPGAEVQDERRDRPFSESDVDRPAPQTELQWRRSASSLPLTLTLDADLDDDVFVSPRADGNDLFSTRNVEIFGYSSPRTPAGVLLSPRRERSFTFCLTSEKHWKDKGGTDVGHGVGAELDADVTDAATPEIPAVSTEKSSPDDSSVCKSKWLRKLPGSICTAFLFVLGWKLFANKR